MRRLLIVLAIALLPSIALAHGGGGGGHGGGGHMVAVACLAATWAAVGRAAR